MGTFEKDKPNTPHMPPRTEAMKNVAIGGLVVTLAAEIPIVAPVQVKPTLTVVPEIKQVHVHGERGDVPNAMGHAAILVQSTTTSNIKPFVVVPASVLSSSTFVPAGQPIILSSTSDGTKLPYSFRMG